MTGWLAACHKCQPLWGSFLLAATVCAPGPGPGPGWVAYNSIDWQFSPITISVSPNRIFAISGDCVGRRETKGSRSSWELAGISWMLDMINLCAMHYISLLNKPGNLDCLCPRLRLRRRLRPRLRISGGNWFGRRVKFLYINCIFPYFFFAGLLLLFSIGWQLVTFHIYGDSNKLVFCFVSGCQLKLIWQEEQEIRNYIYI